MDFNRYQSTVYGSPIRVPGLVPYIAYVPNPIPRHFELSTAYVNLLSTAHAVSGRLDGMGQLLSNPMFLVRPYLTRKQYPQRASKVDKHRCLVREAEAGDYQTDDVVEVLNYVRAVTYALQRLRERRIT